MKQSTRSYELTFILGEKATQEQGEKKTTAVKALIKKLDGKVSKEELWGRRELAYIIAHNRSGFYVTLWFDLPTGNLKAMEQELRFDEDIIRFLTTQAYTTAQPGTLYPAAEEEAEKANSRGKKEKAKEEKVSGEEELRRSSKAKPAKTEAVENSEDEIPEEERLEKIDEALEELLKDQE